MATQIRDTIAEHYYECHITIAPIFDQARERVKTIATKHKFKLATLLMQKRAADTPERSRYDTFMTSHGKSLIDITNRMAVCVNELQDAGFDVYRYKIEDIVMDSRIHDFHQLLRAGQLTHIVAWSGNIKLSLEGPATFTELQQLMDDPTDLNRIGYTMDGPDGRFVTATEALSVALKSGQYTGPRPPDGVLTPELLWGIA